MKRIVLMISLVFTTSPTLAKLENTVPGTWMSDGGGGYVWVEFTPNAIQQVIIPGERPEPPNEPTNFINYRFTAFTGGGQREAAESESSAGDSELLAEPPAENNSDIDCGKATTKPVILTTGEKIKDEVDFNSVGLYGLSLTRKYRSQNASGSLFGANWMSSLDFPSLRFGKRSTGRWSSNAYQEITFIEPDGTKYVFNADSFVYPEVFDKTDRFAIGGNYTVKSALRTGQLTWEKGYGYTLMTSSGTYRYNEGGVLQTVATTSGQVLKIEHRVGGIIDISNNAGQKVQLRLGANHRVAEVQDPAGNVWKYSYNQNGMLTHVTSPDADPDIREYHYEEASAVGAPALLTGISMNGVRYSRYNYYPDGRVRRSALEGSGGADDFVYGASETTVTNAMGASTTFSFAPVKGELEITRVSRAGTSTCAAAGAETVYDANGYIDYVLDWKKIKTDYAYDSYGRLQSKVEAAGTSDALTTTYAWSRNRVTHIEYAGTDGKSYLRYTNAYSGDRLAKQTATDLKTGKQRIINYTHVIRPNGTKASVTVSVQLDDGEAKSVQSYNESGQITSRMNALGQTESWSDFNGLGLPQKYVDINGQATTYSYDKRGLVKSIISPGFRTTNIVYEHDRQIKSLSTFDGRTVEYKYDAGRRQVAVGNGLGEFLEVDINLAGRSTITRSKRKVPAFGNGVLSGSVAAEFSAKTVSDSEGRPYDVLGNNGQKIQRRYDDNGNLLTVTDASGRLTTYEYNFRNQLSRITAADGGVVELAYDNEGQKKTVTDPRKLQTHYGYNGFGNVISLIGPDTGTTSYTYDGAGRLNTEAFADGRIVTYAWDALNRLRSKSTGGSINTYAYDEGAYGKGRLARIQDGTGETTYVYGPTGELLRQTNQILGQVFNTTWTYDGAGRKETMTYPSGVMLKYTYDSAGRISAVKSNGKQ